MSDEFEIKVISGDYSITNDGRVFSTKGKQKRELKGCYVCIHGITYQMVTLSTAGYTKRFFVHRLVAEAFIPNPDNVPTVKHIDGDTLNNHVSNLEWHTKQARRYVPVAKFICQRCGKEHYGKKELCCNCHKLKLGAEATKAKRKAKAETIEFREAELEQDRDIIDAYRRGEKKNVIAKRHGLSGYCINKIIDLYKIK